MHIIRDNATLQSTLAQVKTKGQTIGYAPTMGALHHGHLSLVERLKTITDVVVVSVFVNPTQFGAGEDFNRYPRQEAQDADLLEKVGTDAVWFPRVADIYPHELTASLKANEPLSQQLCGLFRPSHFDGVVTVVMRLLELVKPDIALFGEKDFQQLAVLREAASRYHPSVHILGAPIIREADGLAMSSRNTYLSPQERKDAAMLYRILHECAAAMTQGKPVEATLTHGKQQLTAAGFAVDYLEARTEAGLMPMITLTEPSRLLVAARLGSTRLIDNLPLQQPKKNSVPPAGGRPHHDG